MGKVAGITPTALLLIPPDIVKDNLVIQCPHISINISGHMVKAATMVTVATLRHPDTSTRPQWRSGWTEATMDSQNDGVVQYQR